MNRISKNKKPVTSLQLERILNQHLLFLECGGAGGTWTTIVINGIVLGVYNGSETIEGEQAHLEHGHLGRVCSLKNLLLPFSNCCGLYAPEIQSQNVDLSYSLLTDTYLADANFQNASLRKVDFSRAVLVGVDFRGADLRYTDFENCDLRKADFRGANIQGTRFPGTNLEGVLM